MLIILRNAAFFHVSSRVHSSLNVGKYMIYIYYILYIKEYILYIKRIFIYSFIA